jgi:hypothetical protein
MSFKEHRNSKRAKETNCSADCDRERAGIANREGQRRARSEEIFTANRAQQSVKVAAVHRTAEAIEVNRLYHMTDGIADV